jgi:hypothetical protein
MNSQRLAVKMLKHARRGGAVLCLLMFLCVQAGASEWQPTENYSEKEFRQLCKSATPRDAIAR